jgi:amidase
MSPELPIRIGALETPAPLQRVSELLLRTRTTRLMRLGGVVDLVLERNLAWVPYTQLANMTGRPAISLPLHWTPESLPMGVQLIGRLRSEELLLRLARQLELAAPWADRRPALA